jgi:hypothetical protein
MTAGHGADARTRHPLLLLWRRRSPAGAHHAPLAAGAELDDAGAEPG